MTYNIDAFIRQLQSSIARRKEKIDTYEYIIRSSKSGYHKAKEAQHRYLSTVTEVDLEVIETYQEILTGRGNIVKAHQDILFKLVQQQKTERKMLAYFINEKRYITTKEN